MAITHNNNNLSIYQQFINICMHFFFSDIDISNQTAILRRQVLRLFCDLYGFIVAVFYFRLLGQTRHDRLHFLRDSLTLLHEFEDDLPHSQNFLTSTDDVIRQTLVVGEFRNLNKKHICLQRLFK